MQNSYTNHFSLPVHAVLLLGPTGVGKSPLGDSIAQEGLFHRRCHHLDFGSELRQAVSRTDRSGDYSVQELDFIHGVLERGLLLENEHFMLARKIMTLYLRRVGFSLNDILVLNGIPRHEGQAHDMSSIATVHGVILLDCTAEDVVCRINSNVGGDRTERVDDTGELIEKKLKIFRERTGPLVLFYRDRGAKVYTVGICGTTTTQEAFKAFSMLAAADPPIAFITEPPQR